MALASTDLDAPAAAVKAVIAQSELLKSLATARASTPATRNLRKLLADEITALKSQHNAAEDWSRVWVAQEFNPHKVIGCYFSGEVQLGVFREKVTIEHGVTIGSGVYNCDLNNVSVGDNCYLANTSLIANYHIGPRVIVQGCGRIICSRNTTFGNGQKVSLGLEIQGRDTALFAEMTVEIAARIAANRKFGSEADDYESALAEYIRQVRSTIGVIEAGAVIQNTPKVLDTYVGLNAIIDSAISIENTTILSNSDENTYVGTGACVKDALIQWGCRIDTHAVVEQAMCCEHSSVDCHGKLRKSLLGPNSIVSAGECLHSLVGPFVGFHHQALLIAAYWPDGKGNIAYGANVGSNHTGKAPDQEIWPGEGMFFGLGVNIKFPADFSKAPYSIIASGVATLPQRVEMPFSLINARAESIEGVSPAYNEILPGWVLSDNIYAIRRNERKYAVRNKATRINVGFEVFRPEIVDLMVRARAALQKVETGLTPAKAAVKKTTGVVDVARRPVYTDKDIPGLGKNFMKETARLEGIEAYTFYIRWYALKGLYFGVKFCRQQERDLKGLLEPNYLSDPRYEHERSLLVSEFPGKNIKDLLNELIVAYEKMAADTLLTKEKDDFRGVRIIPDYASVHLPAKEDTFVRITLQEAAEQKEEISDILKTL
ncbi:MAG TPA: DUF4954 family protein [Planctomycetota bacterium]|nr:DUF4954 family protein [Planctomycetota bacterium]